MRRYVKQMILLCFLFVPSFLFGMNSAAAESNFYGEASETVTLYKDETVIGSYADLLSAFDQMTDANGDYTVVLPSGQSSYTLPNNYSWPEVKSIYIDGYDYVNSTIYAGGVQTVNSTVTLSQVAFSQPYEGECTYFQLNIGGHRLILDGELSFGEEFWKFSDDFSVASTSVECSLVGTAESVLEITGGGYKAELWCDMDIGKVILTNGNIKFRGSGKTYCMDEFQYSKGSIDISGVYFKSGSMGGQTVNIDRFVYCPEYSGDISISLQNNSNLNIGDIKTENNNCNLLFCYDGYYEPIETSNITISGSMDCVENIRISMSIYAEEDETLENVVKLNKVAYVPNFSGTTQYSTYSADYYRVFPNMSYRVKYEIGYVSLYLSEGSVYIDKTSFEKTWEEEYEAPEKPQTDNGGTDNEGTDNTGSGSGETQAGDLVYRDGRYYFYENGVMAASKEAYVNGAWRWFDADGSMAVSKDVYQTSSGGKWVRYNENGEMIKGEDYRYGGWYYFEPITGTMMKGPVMLEDGRRVFYDTITGQMLKGTHTINGQTYVFDESDGNLISGQDTLFWVEIDGKKYWYEDWQRQGWDPANEAYRGKEIYDAASDAWYWLDNVQQGAMAVSKDVYQESYSAYPDREDGTGKWVRYDENGHMVKGWQTTAAGTYYFEIITGAMAKGRVAIDGIDYYFSEVTGILQ